MKIVNLTPHSIRLNDGRTFPPSGKVASVEVTYAPISPQGITFPQETTFQNLPGWDTDRQPDTVYIVSGKVLSALARQGFAPNYILAPATGHEQTIWQNRKVMSVPAFERIPCQDDY